LPCIAASRLVEAIGHHQCGASGLKALQGTQALLAAGKVAAIPGVCCASHAPPQAVVALDLQSQQPAGERAPRGGQPIAAIEMARQAFDEKRPILSRFEGQREHVQAPFDERVRPRLPERAATVAGPLEAPGVQACPGLVPRFVAGRGRCRDGQRRLHPHRAGVEARQQHRQHPPGDHGTKA